jgi:hypothetical protein
MTCPECELLLADDEADASVEDHLHGCAKCRALQEELRANALALSSLRDDELPRVKMTERRPVVARPVPWVAAAAAAALLALAAHQASQWKPIVETLPRQVAAPATVTAKLAPAPAPKLAVRRKPKPARRGAALALKEPLLVKMLTPDPDVVVYWIVD